MYTLTILSTFLTSAVLAIPHKQYSYEPAGGPASSIPQISPRASSTSIDWISASETLSSTIALPTTTTTTTVTPSVVFDSTSLAATLSSPVETATTTSSLVPWPTSTATPLPQAGVYICSDVNWGGACSHILSNPTSAPEDCVQLDGTASSIGPDEGFECFFFTNSYCRPLLSDGLDTIELVFPGERNMLQTYNGDYNDKIYSYFCLPGKW